jgi:geranylgeranyl pyrophosphate synthase
VTPPPLLTAYRTRIDRALDAALPAADAFPEAVHEAMRYTALAPSKRMRAAVSLLSAALFGRDERAMGVALAVELVHASSLILDDLPSMDDSATRRGRPACHVRFGEATALLASFALLSQAFDTLATSYDPPLAAQLTTLLAGTVGTSGLIAGQADDLLATERAITFERLERIHRLKTGVLFTAAAVGGALTAGAREPQTTALAHYAKNLGLAFQIVDDLLDVTGTEAETGKPVRADAKKTTFVSFSGIEGARALARELCDTADRALAPFGARADALRALSAFVADRRQ